MANLNGFNANQVEPTSEFEPIPPGKYLASVAHGRQVVQTLYAQYGIECGFATGASPARERDELLARFRGLADSKVPKVAFAINSFPEKHFRKSMRSARKLVCRIDC